MWNQIGEILPKTAALAAVAWAGLNYAVIGPEVAERVVTADHLPACEAGLRARAVDEGNHRIASIARPEVDASKEMAVARLRVMADNPMMRSLQANGLGDLFGLSGQTAMVIRQYEEQKARAAAAYRAAVETVKAETATRLGESGRECGCLADAAIDATRTEWAIFSGTLGLYRPSRVSDFDAVISQAASRASCGPAGGAP